MGSDSETPNSVHNREAESFLRAKNRLTSTLLALFPASMIGLRVCVTLLDDTEVTGRLAFVDGFLNVQLDSGVSVTPSQGANLLLPRNLDEISISGKRVRYIGIPASVDVRGDIQSYLGRSSRNNKSGQRRIRKDKYAYLRNQFGKTLANDENQG